MRRIRSRMYFGVAVLFIAVTVLAGASFHGAWKFRHITKSIQARSTELPLAAELGQRISELRSFLWQVDRYESPHDFHPVVSSLRVTRIQFVEKLKYVEQALDNYEYQLQHTTATDPEIGQKKQELAFVAKFHKSLQHINNVVEKQDWFMGRETATSRLRDELEMLQHDASELPVFLQQRMEAFAGEARMQYYGWMYVSLFLTLLAFGMITLLMIHFRDGIFRPLSRLLEGSRQVARGNYNYKVKLKGDDEMAELAEAMNAMTASFRAIRRDLNKKVQQRTQEVVRSEKMASVGFLAAGVAHEINNPLATIAWAAESLESRLYEILDPDADDDHEACQENLNQMKKYLRQMQDEAFRCKEITGGLLDFSRMGDFKKVPTNLAQVIQNVIEMVKPLSKYRDRTITFDADHGIIAVVNAQEIKQVALNLITNALGSVDEGGKVDIQLKRKDGGAELRITDNGCGMTDEVKRHLFEPFFTRRRNGQGTGLGLSITYQIIEDHGGRIVPYSAGPDQGSTFTVTLPLEKHDSKNNNRSTSRETDLKAVA